MSRNEVVHAKQASLSSGVTRLIQEHIVHPQPAPRAGRQVETNLVGPYVVPSRSRDRKPHLRLRPFVAAQLGQFLGPDALALAMGQLHAEAVGAGQSVVE